MIQLIPLLLSKGLVQLENVKMLTINIRNYGVYTIKLIQLSCQYSMRTKPGQPPLVCNPTSILMLRRFDYLGILPVNTYTDWSENYTVQTGVLQVDYLTDTLTLSLMSEDKLSNSDVSAPSLTLGELCPTNGCTLPFSNCLSGPVQTTDK